MNRGAVEGASATPMGGSADEGVSDEIHDADDGVAQYAEPLSEDSGPADLGSEIVEKDVLPGTGPILRTQTPSPPPHVDTVRAALAFCVVLPVLILYALVVAAGLFGFITFDDALPFIAALSGPQALAAAVVGFYYGKRD